MGKKRKFEVNSRSKTITKSASVEVIVEDVTSHPLCFHGPTLLFSNENGRYYSCSLCRNNKECTVHITAEEWAKDGVRKRNEKYLALIPKINKSAAWRHLNEVKSENPSNRAYCTDCKELLVLKSSKHNTGHHIVNPLTDDQIAKPSSWLPPLENDSVEAQYIFNKRSVAAILQTLLNNKISNILCIGTPSVHESASALPNFNSLLLDYDTRHSQFNKPDKYIWYNMFNNYLFNGREDEKILKSFIKNSISSGLCIVMDPPFGGRVEPLVQTIKELTQVHNELCKSNLELLPVIWAFPYFSEPYIVNSIADVKMHDYQVEYENHKSFQNGSKGRKHGSPVRLFTNLPLSSIDLSNNSSYKYCDQCKYWVNKTNSHCKKCDLCTSKNGMTYKHCNVCERCVKPTFVHCKECGRCCQEKDHVCGIVVESQSCFNCREKGHKKSNCPKLESTHPKKKRRRT